MELLLIVFLIAAISTGDCEYAPLDKSYAAAARENGITLSELRKAVADGAIKESRTWYGAYRIYKREVHKYVNRKHA